MPATNKELREKLTALINAADVVGAAWEGGELAAAVRELITEAREADALLNRA